jgi:hypothetical protein
MNKFLTTDFWFNISAGELEPPFQKILIGVTIIFLILAIILVFLKKKNQNSFYYKTINSFHLFFIVNFVIGLFLFFFTYQGILFLSSRFWFLIWVLSMLLWLNSIRLITVKIPNIKENAKNKADYNKYIP